MDGSTITDIPRLEDSLIGKDAVVVAHPGPTAGRCV